MVGRAAGGEVDHAIRALLDDFQERRKGLGTLIGLTGLRIAGVQMHDRRAGFRASTAASAISCGVTGSAFDIEGGVDRAGHGAG